MRLMTNEELKLAAGNGCDTVVASVSAALAAGGRNIAADLKATADRGACIGIAQTGADAIKQVSNVVAKANISGDPLTGILESNNTFDNYDGPPTIFGGSGSGGGRIVEFVIEVQ